MFEDLAQSATAVFLFALAGFCMTWLLAPPHDDMGIGPAEAEPT